MTNETTDTDEVTKNLQSQLMSLSTVTSAGFKHGSREITATVRMHGRPGAYGYTKRGGHRRPDDYPHIPDHVYRLADRFGLEVEARDRQMGGADGYKRVFRLVVPDGEGDA